MTTRNSEMNPGPVVHPKLTPVPSPAMRDCVQCQLPFFSRSTANVVCLVCREATDFERSVMACTCRSYNNPVPRQTTPEVVLTTPFWGHTDRRTIPVDACIAPVILALWNVDIWPLSSCCGHGDPERRSVVVNRDDRGRANDVIQRMGDCAKVLAWELVE